MMSENILYYGDNLDILRKYIKDETVDLIYLDPPFNSNKDYNVIFREPTGERSEAQMKAFKDTWHWNGASSKFYFDIVQAGGRPSQVLQGFQTFLGDCGLLAYLSYMAIRLIELRRVLKSTGSIYLHCDPTASHYLKILMDAIFGPENFRNEIAWRRSRGASDTSSQQFPRNHDNLLVYSKGMNQQYFKIFKPYSKNTLSMYKYDDGDGRGVYRLQEMGNYGKKTIDMMRKQNLIVETDRLNFKQHLSEKPGVVVDDMWEDINPLCYASAKERTGYPTQKPEALLKRIIEASSKEGDLVLDPFAGSGTTLAVAQKMNRRWIGIDVTHLAVATIKRRISQNFYHIIGEPTDLSGAKDLAARDPYQFQWWVLGLVGACPTERKKGSDKGIDGRLYFKEGPGKDAKTGQILFSVKSGSVDVTQVRDLRGVVEREGAEMGVFICLQEPTQPMLAEAASAGFYKTAWKEYPKLQIISVEELLTDRNIDIPMIELIRR